MSLSQSQMQEITGPVVAVGDGDGERCGDPVPTDTDDTEQPGSRPVAPAAHSATLRPRRVAAAVAFAGEEVSAQQLLLQAGDEQRRISIERSFVIMYGILSIRA